jgi:hypothetical protein
VLLIVVVDFDVGAVVGRIFDEVTFPLDKEVVVVVGLFREGARRGAAILMTGAEG